MKHKCIIVLIMISGFAASAMANMSVVLYDAGGYHTATVTSSSDPVGIYQPNETFRTFCLEKNEYFHPGRTYNVGISEVAMYNNYSTSNGYDAVLGGDPLDDRTAYLYTMYMSGTTWGYTSQDFQNAIHNIEEEGVAANSLVAIANAAVEEDGEWYNMGLGNVRVMNVWYLDGTKSQDQLVMVPAPGALLLGGLGIGLVGLLRKRKSI